MCAHMPCLFDPGVSSCTSAKEMITPLQPNATLCNSGWPHELYILYSSCMILYTKLFIADTVHATVLEHFVKDKYNKNRNYNYPLKPFFKRNPKELMERA